MRIDRQDTTAEPPACFDEQKREAGAVQAARSRKAGQAAADDEDWICHEPFAGSGIPAYRPSDNGVIEACLTHAGPPEQH
jgi:hypothetical protein